MALLGVGLGEREKGRKEAFVNKCLLRERERSFDFWTNTQWNVIFCSGKGEERGERSSMVAIMTRI